MTAPRVFIDVTGRWSWCREWRISGVSTVLFRGDSGVGDFERTSGGKRTIITVQLVLSKSRLLYDMKTPKTCLCL